MPQEVGRVGGAPVETRHVGAVGLLFESRSDIEGLPGYCEETHYHWREPEEVDAVEAALLKLGFDTHRLGPIEALLQNDISHVDCVFNLSVRTLSRNRTALGSAILEAHRIPSIGGDVLSKVVTLNKHIWKPIASCLRVPTPRWVVYQNGAKVPALPPFDSWLLKPVSEGYSLGMEWGTKTSGLEALRRSVHRIGQRFCAPVLCERFIDGRELCVAVVGHPPAATARVLVFDGGGGDGPAMLRDTASKRASGSAFCLAEPDDPAAILAIQAAFRMAEALGPADYATFDFRVDPQRGPFLVDINFDATLHPERSLACAFRQTGVDYVELIRRIVEAAFFRQSLTGWGARPGSRSP